MKLHKKRTWLIKNYNLHIYVKPHFFYCSKPANNGLTFSVKCYDHEYSTFFDSYSDFNGRVPWLTTLPDEYDEALKVGVNECLKLVLVKTKESFLKEEISSNEYEKIKKKVKKLMV